jgi:hypothetical protein
MITSMDNGSITGKEYPKTLAEAYEVTRLWVVPAQKKAGSTTMTLVGSEDSSRPKSGGGRGGGKGSTGGRGSGGRGKDTTTKPRSPPAKKLLKKVKFEGSKNSSKVDLTGWVVPARCEPDSKTCRGCLKKGHIWANCPDRTAATEKVLVGQEEDDWESEN